MSDNIAIISLRRNLKTFKDRFKECSSMYNKLKNKESAYALQIAFMAGYYGALVEMTENAIDKQKESER